MLSPGARIGDRYEIIAPLGAGAMGVVFSARRLALDDVVAIKVIHPDTDTPLARERFVREARAMARIRHPHVVQVFDFGDPPQERGEPAYLVMELLEGPTLADLVRTGPMDPTRLVEIFVDICGAVEAGHRRGVVHRDLKPSNVVLSRDDDGRESIKVLDFGLARIVGTRNGDAPIEGTVAAPGAIVGTIAYMSPEQVEGGGANASSDIWALGVLLYELATGSLPFSAHSPVAAIMKIAEGKYDDPRSHVPGLPDALVEGIRVALLRDPERRPASALALGEKVAGRSLARARPIAVASDSTPHPSRASTEPRHAAGSAAHHAGSSSDLSDSQRATLVSVPGSASSRPRSPLIGRDHVFEALEDELLAARTRHSARVVVIRGDPGSGKTAVTDRFAEQVASRATVRRGRFFLYEGDRPPPGETYAWMLGDGPGGRPLSTDDATAGQDRWRSYDALARRFAASAQGEQVLLIVLDDVQWATRLELEFLDYLFRALDDRPALIVMTARSDAARSDAQSELSRWILRFARQQPGRLSSMMLDAFDDEDILAWLGTKLERPHIQPADVRRLRQLTGGNPAYLEELLRHLQGRGAVVREDLATRVRVEDEGLPESIAQTLLANLADLEAEVRDVVEAASVVGEELRFETLQATTGADEEPLEALLDRACARGVLTDRGTSAGADYRFVSPAIRAALYDNIPRRRRRRLHRAVVEALERVYARDRRRIAKILCIHHHATEDWAESLEWGLLAADAALDAFDADTAEASLTRCEDAVEQLRAQGEPPSQRIIHRLRLLRGVLANRVGQYADADAALGAVAEWAHQQGIAADELRAVLERVDSQTGQGALAEAHETAERALTLSLAADDPDATARARVLLGSVLARLGRYDDVAATLAPVFEDRDPTRSNIRARALREQGWTDTRRGEMQHAAELGREVLSIADRHDDPMARYLGTSLQALVQAEGGDARAAVPLYQEAQRMARALSLRRREMIETANMAMSMGDLGRHDEALQAMLQVRALCLDLGDRASLGDSMIGMAKLLIARGDLDEAVDSLEAGLAIADETGRAEYALIAVLELGDLELTRARPEAAEARFRDALARLERVESHYGWRAHAGLARAIAAGPDPARRAPEIVAEGRLALEQIEAVRARRIGGEDAPLEATAVDCARLVDAFESA